jgi:hypothetical protein
MRSLRPVWKAGALFPPLIIVYSSCLPLLTLLIVFLWHGYLGLQHGLVRRVIGKGLPVGSPILRQQLPLTGQDRDVADVALVDPHRLHLLDALLRLRRRRDTVHKI